jgi:two-component system, LytTR family, sensor histidine kinase AlgZ
MNGVTAEQQITGLARPETNSGQPDSFYIPEFTSTNAVMALVIMSQLVAVVLSLARGSSEIGFFGDMAKTSLLMFWMTLTSALALTVLRDYLGRLDVVWATTLSLGLVLINIALVSEFIIWLGTFIGADQVEISFAFFPDGRWEFVSRNLAIGAIVCIVLFRYFYIMHQWRKNVQLEAASRIAALQARIRPHFLFNSMNTIAALTRTNPEAAEQATEDLADLFRASLASPVGSISLEQELEVMRVYQRMEEQRLGERLSVNWELADVPLDTRVPGLTIQPLLENAIYHGIEPLPEGGVIKVKGTVADGMVTISVTNPIAVNQNGLSTQGNQLALDNIRQRLELAYGDRGKLEIEKLADTFCVKVGFPLTT